MPVEWYQFFAHRDAQLPGSCLRERQTRQPLNVHFQTLVPIFHLPQSAHLSWLFLTAELKVAILKQHLIKQSCSENE
jgi:hypothetical protein